MKRLFLSMLALIFLPFSGAIAVAQSAGVNGDWEVTLSTPNGPRNAKAAFRQDGENLTGQYKGSLNEGPLTGTVRGNQIQFSFKVPDADAAFTFTGTIEKNAMKGTVQLGGFGSGTWTAKRQ